MKTLNALSRAFRRASAVGVAAAVALGCMSAAFAEPTTAYMDKQSDSLRAAQQRLINLGLLKGSADGAYGPKTADALSTFQDQNGLDATGHLDAATLELLTHVSADAATAIDVQQRLIDLGYLKGRADGIIGPNSIEALKLFQRLQGLKASGKADVETLGVLFSNDAIALPATLSGGSKGEDVQKLQKRLIQYGFMDGDADGSYGQATVSAVRAFQRHLIDQGYEEWIKDDGTASSLTQYCLYSDRYSSYLRPLEPGDQDAEVLRIERRLNRLGYMDMAADDTFDDYAQNALELFGEQAGLPDGEVSRDLVDALFDARAPMAAYCAPHDIASGDSGLAVRDLESALINGGLLNALPEGKYSARVEDAVSGLYSYLSAQDDAAAEMFSDPKAVNAQALQRLREGLLGYRTDDMADKVEARRIQNRLYTLCYLPKDGIDGKFGRNTEAAIAEFQSANGLVATGEPDEATQGILFSASAKPKPYPYRIEVLLDQQLVEVYELDDTFGYHLVESFTCSTGLHDSTPRGIFLDGRPANRWHYFEKFNCWAQYSYVITGDIMFHSVIYSSDNENSLRSGSLYALGNPASHGCVRLKVEDAKWLYEHCKRGKAAIIIH